MVKNKADLLKSSPRRIRPLRRSLSRIRQTDSASSKGATPCANVKVVVRIRPLNDKELGTNNRTIIKILDDNVVVFDPKEDVEPFFYLGVKQKGRDMLKKENKNIQFTFDKVFGYNAKNTDVFDGSTKNLIGSLMEGYNCSVFVYGATGAGKTHTMLGDDTNPGITILTMHELFLQMEEMKAERDFELGITYLEVYNETVKDLLNPGPSLHLREDGKFGLYVAGIQLHRTNNPKELFSLLKKGNGNRTQHPTDANAESSRSHAVFQVYVNMLTRTNGQRQIAKLSMIDLAGSERGAATGCKGIRFTEGANINKSLLALGNCINSLADGHRHIPFRDSKLTRLLKDSLGGNCQTVMIANISPSHFNYEDTYNTLKYATRASKIKSNMKKNVVSCQLTIPEYNKLVDDLQKENERLKEQLKAQSVTATVTTVTSCSCQENREESHQQEKEIAKQVPEEDPVWRTQLQELLKEKVNLQKQLVRLKNSEKVIQYKIQFKESSEDFMKAICLTDEQLESGHNRIVNTLGSFQRQLNSASRQIKEVENQQDTLEIKLQTLIDSQSIDKDKNIDILHTTSQLNRIKNEMQEEHMKYITELHNTEWEHREKIMVQSGSILKTYHQLLAGNSIMTENMKDSYRSLVRMAQGVRSVTWQDDEKPVVPVQSQDSGISISFPAVKSRLNLTRNEQFTIRSNIKRKLEEPDSTVNTLPEVQNENDASASNLNETTTLLQSSIDAHAINSTFCLHDKDKDKEPVAAKKKFIAENRRNVVCAENMLTKVYKHPPSSLKVVKNEKFGLNKTPSKKTYVVRNQRFPLRNKEPLAAPKSKISSNSSTPRNRI